MGTLLSLSTSPRNRGDKVITHSPAYEGRHASLSRPAIPRIDGTERWYVTFIGSHSEIIFTADELELVDG